MCSFTKSRAGTCCERRPRRSSARGVKTKRPRPSRVGNLGPSRVLLPSFLGYGRPFRSFLGFRTAVPTVFRPHSSPEQNRATVTSGVLSGTSERGQDQTRFHRKDPRRALYVYKMTPPKGLPNEPMPERPSHRELPLLQSEVGIWSDKTTAKQRGVDWQFKIDDARTKLKRLYPKIYNGPPNG